MGDVFSRMSVITKKDISQVQVMICYYVRNAKQKIAQNVVQKINALYAHLIFMSLMEIALVIVLLDIKPMKLRALA